MDYNVDNIESKPEINPTVNTDIVLHKDGKFQRAKIFGSDGKIKQAFVDSVIEQTILNNTYELDPEQIVPSEALYNDVPETLAGDVLKRVDFDDGVDVNYREVATWYDGSVMDDSKVDNIVFIKRNGKYYQKQIDKNKLLKVDTIDDLRNFNGYYEGQKIGLLGYYDSADKPFVSYEFTHSNFADNGGSNIKSDVGTWRFKKQNFIDINGADFGLKGDSLEDQTEKFRAAINFAKGRSTAPVNLPTGGTNSMFYNVYRLVIPSGKYIISETILIDSDICLAAGTKNSVLIEYTGIGDAFVVNSAFVGDYLDPLAVRLVNTFGLVNINVHAPNGNRCVVIGSSVFRWIFFEGCSFTGAQQWCVELGQAVYFPLFKNCEFKAAKGGIKVGAYTDLLTVTDRCQFNYIEGTSIHTEAATFIIENTDFEVNSGAKGEIVISNSDGINARNGIIFGNRFGNENFFAQGTPYDIYIDNPNGTNNILSGIYILGNNHTTRGDGTYTKTAPVFINCHVNNLRIEGNTFSIAYLSKLYVQGGDYAKYNLSFGNTFDRLYLADPLVRGIFNSSKSEFFKFGIQGSANFSKFALVYTGEQAPTDNQDKPIDIKFIPLTVNSNRLNYENVIGITLTVLDTNSNLKPIAVASEGSIVQIEGLDLTGVPIGSLVYATTTSGVYTTTTPIGGSNFIVGRTTNQINSVRLQFENKYIKTATSVLAGSVLKSAAVTNSTAADATDLATALTLVNELKAKLNAKLVADRASGQQAT